MRLWRTKKKKKGKKCINSMPLHLSQLRSYKHRKEEKIFKPPSVLVHQLIRSLRHHTLWPVIRSSSPSLYLGKPPMVIQIWKKNTHEDLLMEASLRFSYIASRSVFSFLMTAPSFSIRISLHYPSIQKCKAVTSDQIITSMVWWTIALLNCISDLQKTTSRQDTETTLHTLFHGVSFHEAHPTIVQVKDATSALKTICLSELPSLNERNELVSSCRHRNKALLRKSWTNHLNLPPHLLCKFYSISTMVKNILAFKIP